MVVQQKWDGCRSVQNPLAGLEVMIVVKGRDMGLPVGKRVHIWTRRMIVTKMVS